MLPYIDLRAYAHVTNPDPDPTRNAVGSADITVSVSGPADELASGTGSAITYASNPPYSQEQIIGLLLDASVFGAVNFGQQQNGTTLRGAPGESNPLLPPGVTPYQIGVINFNQEAFSILNGQLTQRFLTPIERVFTGRFGLTDFELTVDYGGGVGYNALKQLGKRDVYASFGQTLSTPVRTTLGLHRAARRDDVGAVQLFRAERQPGDHQRRQRRADGDAAAAPGHPAAEQPARIHLFDRPEVPLTAPALREALWAAVASYPGAGTWTRFRALRPYQQPGGRPR